MAETGTISSIIGVIGAGTRVSLTLFQFGASTGSAGTEARAIGTEITLFCSVLKQLHSTLTNARSFRHSINAIDTIHEVLDQCQEIFNDIESIIDGLQKRKAANLEPSLQFISRVRWTSKKSKLQLLRTRLESCKITLHIMLTTLDFAQRIATRRLSTIESQEEDDQEEAVTQSLIIAQQAAVDELERLEELEEEEESTEIDDYLSSDKETNPIPDLPAWDNPFPTFPSAKKKTSVLAERGIGAQSPTAAAGTPISPRLENGRSGANRRSALLNDILLASSIDPDVRPQSLESNWTSTHSWRQSSTSSRQSVYLLQKWTDQGAERPSPRENTSSRSFSTGGEAEAQAQAARLRELELQISQLLQAQEEMKASYEAREQEAEETNREKLSQLENDYQSAVHYVKGTEKMLKRMKDELAKYKAENQKIKEEAKQAKVTYDDRAYELANYKANMKKIMEEVEEAKATFEARGDELAKYKAENTKIKEEATYEARRQQTEKLAKIKANITKIMEEAEEAKTTYEAREQEAEKTYREKLSQLENDYQSAVHYVKGTEKMLKRMKDELAKYKAENTKMKEQLAEARERSTNTSIPFNMSSSKYDWEDELAEDEDDHTKMKEQLVEAQEGPTNTSTPYDMSNSKYDWKNHLQRSLEKLKAENSELKTDLSTLNDHNNSLLKRRAVR